MSGGIRSSVKRYTAKHVTVDIDTVHDEAINGNRNAPQAAADGVDQMRPAAIVEPSVSHGKIRCLPMLCPAAKERGQQLKNDPNCAASTLKWGGEMDPVVLDDIISRLLEVRSSRPGKQVQLSESEVRQLCICSREIFLKQPNLLELEAPVTICGNIHGQYPDLLSILETGGFPPSTSYLFLGGYVDYGKQGLETMCLLLAYKIKYPENFFLLRGNHECASINRIYGFYDECKRRYNVRVWKSFTDTFNCLPVAAVIDDKIFCVHGGLSPDLKKLDQIRNLPRPTAVPDAGLLCDLLWSAPSKDVRGWGQNSWNDMDISFTFGPDVVTEFLMKHDLDLVCRAQQVVEDGYEFFADTELVEDGYEFFADGQLITIFSAPNYCGEYGNAGAILSVDETLMCSFRILKPRKPKFMM